MPTLYLFRLSFAALCIIVFFSCKKDNEFPSGTLKLKFIHTVDGQDLVLGDKEFVNAAGNTFRIEKLKYYISNVKLRRQDGSFFTIPDGYFLIEESTLYSRKDIELSGIPAGKYTSLSFAIGVDSARNFSTQMVGELNPNNDMAWNWVSGYKFFLLEGKYLTKSALTDAIVYHIGGNTSYRTVSLSPQTGDITINNRTTTQADLLANVNKVFGAATIVDLNNIHAVMEPGKEANIIADNYTAGMFVIQQVSTK